MKKGIFWGMAAAALLFMFTTGCGNETTAYPDPIPTVSQPINMKTIVYDGAIIITWVNPPDVRAYSLHRRDTSTGAVKVLVATTNTLDTSYVDYVGWNNQLINGRNYDYIVTYQGANDFTTGQPYLLDSAGTTTATAKVPEKIDATIGEVTVNEYDAGSARIVVKFPNKPNLAYRVKYVYGQEPVVEELVRAVTAGGTTYNNWYDPFYYVTFPAIGGKATISVESYFNDSYYDDTDVVKIAAPEIDLFTFGNVTTFTATQNGTGVFLTWSTVENAETYEIYRATVDGPSTGFNFAGVTVISDWEKITVTPTLDTSVVNRMHAQDTTAKEANHYVYAIIAIEAGTEARSVPSFAYEEQSINAVNGPSLGENTLNISVDYDGSDPMEAKMLDVTFTGVEAETVYKFEYAPVTHVTPPSNVTSLTNAFIGTWDTIAIPATAYDYIANKAIFSVNVPADMEQGQNYVFRVTATLNDQEKRSYAFVNSGAFSVEPYFNLYVSNESQKVVISVIPTNRISGRTYSFNVYRRDESDPDAKYIMLTTPTSLFTINCTTDAFGEYTNTFTGADGTVPYRYKFVLTNPGFNATSNTVDFEIVGYPQL